MNDRLRHKAAEKLRQNAERRRTEPLRPVFLPPSLYAAAQAAGHDMSGFAPTVPLKP